MSEDLDDDLTLVMEALYRADAAHVDTESEMEAIDRIAAEVGRLRKVNAAWRAFRRRQVCAGDDPYSGGEPGRQREVRSCQCSDEQACLFTRQRDAALAEVERLKAVQAALVVALEEVVDELRGPIERMGSSDPSNRADMWACQEHLATARAALAAAKATLADSATVAAKGDPNAPKKLEGSP